MLVGQLIKNLNKILNKRFGFRLLKNLKLNYYIKKKPKWTKKKELQQATCIL